MSPTTALIIIIILTIFGSLWFWYQSTVLSECRRNIENALLALQREIKSNDAILAERKQALQSNSNNFLKAQFNQRARTVPIEAIKEAGATNVRISLLQSAGYRTLADLANDDMSQLRRIRGIGETSVKKIGAAVKELSKRIKEIPPTLPSLSLDEPYSAELVESAGRMMEAQECLSAENQQIKEMYRSLPTCFNKYKADTGFTTWLFKYGKARKDLYREAVVHSGKIIDKCHHLERSEPFVIAKMARKYLADPFLYQTDKQDLINRYQERYADYCACMEESFGAVAISRGQKPPSRANIPREIADKVEKFELDVANLRVTLRPYQKFGAQYILVQQQTILGDEMGLGKTIEALAAVVHIWNKNSESLFLVVSPAGITPNWEQEISNRTSIPFYRIHGFNKESTVNAWLKDGGIAIVSYNFLKNLDLPERLSNLGKKIDALIADEAHYIKNPAAKRTNAIASLLPLANIACFMSGTPMENHPREFVRLIDLVKPGEGKRYLKYQPLLDSAVKDSIQFHGLAAPIYLRRNQQDVLRELPEKIEVSEWVEMTLSESLAYAKAVATGNFMGMRRSVTIGNDKSSAKLKRLDELIKEHRESKRKVLIYSFFLDVLDVLKNKMNPVGVITGALSPGKRMELVEKFRKSKGHQILLSQIEAGGLGINLQCASVVIIMEPQLKPTTEAQAIARAHRMGQTKRVIVHRLLTRNSVDERLFLMLLRKQDLFDEYARESSVKHASTQATETKMIKEIISSEQKRLGLHRVKELEV